VVRALHVISAPLEGKAVDMLGFFLVSVFCFKNQCSIKGKDVNKYIISTIPE